MGSLKFQWGASAFPISFTGAPPLQMPNDSAQFSHNSQRRDALCSGTKMFLFWCVPSFAFALGFFVSPGLKTVLWTLSLGFMGTVCLLNASRCGRIHCYFTGPFFIVGAVTSLGYGIGLLPFGPSGWKWIGDITIIGAIVLSCIPELVLGRYRRNGPGMT